LRVSVIKGPIAGVDHVPVTRRQVAGLLACAAAASCLAASLAAWSTFDYWEGGPIAATFVSVAVLTGLSVFVVSRRVALAIAIGLVSGLGALWITGLVTVSRWAR